MAAVIPARTTVRWVNADEEVEATSWEDMATKLKAPPAKKDTRDAVYRVKVLNHLGSQGWELAGHTTEQFTGEDVWTFKRKVRK